MKVLFLDIDGVLNTHKSTLLHGSLFINSPDVAKKLDPYASLFLKRLTQHGVQIVLSSTWRIGTRFHQEKEKAFDFPILDRTCHYPFPKAVRGDEIQTWLNEHPEVTHYAIVDDDSDMLEAQLPCFVKTRATEGLTWFNMEKICQILGFEIWELAKYRKEVDCESV